MLLEIRFYILSPTTMNKQTKSEGKKWQCDSCYEEFSSKQDLIDHLEQEAEDAMDTADTCQYQLNELK